MPDVLVALSQRLVRWGVLPPHKTPDSAIINIYDVVRHPACSASFHCFAGGKISCMRRHCAAWQYCMNV